MLDKDYVVRRSSLPSFPGLSRNLRLSVLFSLLSPSKGQRPSPNLVISLLQFFHRCPPSSLLCLFPCTSFLHLHITPTIIILVFPCSLYSKSRLSLSSSFCPFQDHQSFFPSETTDLLLPFSPFRWLYPHAPNETLNE